MANGDKTTFPNDAITVIEQADGSKALQTVPASSSSSSTVVEVPQSAATYAYSVAQSSALEASHVVKANAGNLRSLSVRLDSTAPNGTYYVQIINAAALPSNGAVAMLYTPTKKIHTSGVDDVIGIDFTANGIHAITGIVVALSSTEFTLTVGSAYLSIGALYL